MTPHPKLGFERTQTDKPAGPEFINFDYSDRNMLSARAQQLMVSLLEIAASDDSSFRDGTFVAIGLRVEGVSVHVMLAPDLARNVAAALLNGANAIDGGVCQ